MKVVILCLARPAASLTGRYTCPDACATQKIFGYTPELAYAAVYASPEIALARLQRRGDLENDIRFAFVPVEVVPTPPIRRLI